MSEMTDVEKQQETPSEREPATGRLVPRWFKMLYYLIFLPLTVLGIGLIVHSVSVQSKLTHHIANIRGDLNHNPAMDASEVQEALEYLKKHPKYSFLYCNQEILQEPADDPRMLRAFALRKTVAWEVSSRRRQVINTVLENMGDQGVLHRDFELTADITSVLKRIVQERRGDPTLSYAETQITEVLDWLAKGAPGQPRGAEKRHLRAYARQLEKELFTKNESAVLAAMAANWATMDNDYARSAAEYFQRMLGGEQTALPQGVAQYVAERADDYEDLYRRSMERLAEAASRMLSIIVEDPEITIGHSHIYQYLSLLRNKYEGVRENVKRGAWTLRHNQYTIRFLSGFLERATINPVLAVETPRLSKEEHERVMRAENDRRRRASLDLLARIALDYVKNPQTYQQELAVEDAEQYMGEFVIHVFEEMVDDEQIGQEVKEKLAEIREAEGASGATSLFTS